MPRRKPAQLRPSTRCAKDARPFAPINAPPKARSSVCMPFYCSIRKAVEDEPGVFFRSAKVPSDSAKWGHTENAHS